MREIIVDSFAGGGGASLGIALALGRGPDVAINHDAEAIAMHAANHPETQHHTKDIWSASPATVTKGMPVGLLWSSPACNHFSRAKGGKPVTKTIRSLAWIVVKWAAEVRPRVIILENVREFEMWGPLIQKFVDGAPQVLDDGSPVLVPDPSRKGHSFNRWAGRLRGLGYEVQWRVLNAADYGAPTHRRRLFLVARCDGQPIVWPEPTHGNPNKLDDTPLFARMQPWRTAAECIDWSIPCPSIFARNKDLADNTLKRIAMGIKRYVLENPKPFIVQVNHAGPEFRGQSVDEPLSTVTGKHGYGVARIGQINGNGKYSQAVDDPLATITSKAEHILVSPCIAQLAHGNGPIGTTFGDGRANGVNQPLGTAHAGGNNHALVSVFLAKHFGGVVGHELTRPIGTVTSVDHHSLVAANLVRFNFDDAPLPTVTVSNHAALVYSFLTRYFGTAIGQHCTEPLYTITGKDRFGLATVMVAGEPWVIVDIGMRMLTPRELARAQGFPNSYILTGSKSSQVARIGNSVPPAMAEMLVRANYAPAKAKRKARVS